jgi:hypothetical protein
MTSPVGTVVPTRAANQSARNTNATQMRANVCAVPITARAQQVVNAKNFAAGNSIPSAKLGMNSQSVNVSASASSK